ncbi:MAG: acyl-ACP--UDP-N-acetylglucosamine O-acyltransferase [Planctomycetia bacterium]|nr:acyl-ACP--UDP-N-acetylglucosamine O-acyltransferase [Planctomycetia bacterium]
MNIHPTAIVSSEAKIASNVEIGPFAIVEAGTVIESGCVLEPRVSVKRGTTLGEGNVVCEGSILGHRPQHIHMTEPYGGLIIGRDNTIREHCTIHCAMYPDKCTQVGDSNFIMAGAHIAHDCVFGNHIILTNNAMLAGHVQVEDHANISGLVGVHQFCRIGMFAMVGGTALIVQDVPPFVTVDGGTSLAVGVNLIGLRRANVSNAEIRQIQAAYKVLYGERHPWPMIVESLRSRFPSGMASHFADFLEGAKKRGIILDRRSNPLKLVRVDEAESARVKMVSRVSEEESVQAIRVTG